MKNRIIVALKINKQLYKFFSIIFDKRDTSFYVYQHLKDEDSPSVVREPFHMLKTQGDFFIGSLGKKRILSGSQIKLSVHPKRIYLKKREKNGKETHLIDNPFETQPFVKKFRFHAFVIPPSPSLLESYQPNPKKAKTIIFEWSDKDAPQVEIFELEKDYDLLKIDEISPGAIKREIIPSDGLHPRIMLAIRKSVVIPPDWIPGIQYFGRSLSKKPINKTELQRIIKYNNLSFDLSSIPDNAVINDIKTLSPSIKGRLKLDSSPAIRRVNFVSPEYITPPSLEGIKPNEISLVNHNTEQKTILVDYLDGLIKDINIIDFVKTNNINEAINHYDYTVPCDPGVGYVLPSGEFIPLLKIIVSFNSTRRNYKLPTEKQLKKGEKRAILGTI